MERVWPPRPGGERGESLAATSRGGVWRESGLHGQEHIFHREPSCFSSRFSHAYSLLCSAFCTFVSCLHACFTVLLAYDIFTLLTACIFTIACLLPTKLKAELTCTVPMRALLWSNSCNPCTTCVRSSERKYFHL